MDCFCVRHRVQAPKNKLPLVIVYCLQALAATVLAVVAVHAAARRHTWQDTVPTQANAVCRYRYQAPTFTSPSSSRASVYQLQADSGELALSGQSTFTGNVRVDWSNTRLFADTLTAVRDAVSRQVTRLSADGHLLVEQPTIRIRAQSAQVDFTRQSLQLNHADYRFYPEHARGRAQQINHVSGSPFIIRNARYTTCLPDSDVWAVDAKKLIIDRARGQGQAYHAWLTLHDVPVFFVPYLSFPLRNIRKSGFLTPSYRITDNTGHDILLPYYLNLAPNYDATLATRVMAARGLQLQSEFRFLSRTSRVHVAGSLLPHDRRLAQEQRDNARLAPLATSDPRRRALVRASTTRTQLDWQAQSQWGRHWSVKSRMRYVSDDNLERDLLVQPAFGQDRQLPRALSTHYVDDNTEFALRFLDWQILQPIDREISAEPYRLLPSANLLWRMPLAIDDLSFAVRTRYDRYLHRPDPRSGVQFTTGTRIDLNPRLTYHLNTAFIRIVPSIAFHQTIYDMHLGQADVALNRRAHVSRSVPIYRIDSQLYLDRDIDWFGHTDTQTIEPHAHYVYIPFVEQNQIPSLSTRFSTLTFGDLYRSNRFNGIDRIGDTNHVVLGVRSNWLAQSTHTVRASIDVAQVHYFSDRRVTVCDKRADPRCIRQENAQFATRRSNLFLHADVNPTDAWRLHYDTQLDPDYRRVRNRIIETVYQPAAQQAISLSYAVSRDNDNQNYSQLIGSFAWQLTPKWNILGQHYYDLTANRLVQSFWGVEYESCCWAVRVSHHRYVRANINDDSQYDNTLFFQVVLKGLYRYGHSHETLARRILPGYNPSFGARYQ